MLTNSKIALSLALVLGTVSAGLAAPKHAVRHHTAIQRQVPAGAYLSFGSVRPTGSVNTPTYMKIQDIGLKENLGD
jgi:hypothetical protein